MLKQVLIPGNHRLFGHPDDHRIKFLLTFRYVAGSDQHVATAHINFILQCQRDTQRCKCFVAAAIKRHNVFDVACFPGRQGHDFVALANDPGGNRSGKAAEIEIGAQDVLNGKPKVFQVAIRTDVNAFQKIHQRTALVPGRAFTQVNDVIPIERRNRYEVQVGTIQARSKFPIVFLDLLENLFIKIDQVHFVDGDQNVLDTQQ